MCPWRSSGSSVSVSWTVCGNSNVCVLDDVAEVVGQIEWERALFGVLREIEESGGRLVVSAEAPPALLKWALPDLGSRFGASAIFQVRVLDEVEQQAALQLRARTAWVRSPGGNVAVVAATLSAGHAEAI